MLRTLAAAGLVYLVSGPCAAQSTWERNANWIEEQIEDCADGWDATACRYFSARALNRLFGVPKVCRGQSCMDPNQLAEEIAKGGAWAQLGAATEQTVLDQAQQMATGGLPVVAVNASVGWVVLVMPGNMYPSQRWRRNVPVAVGTRLDEPYASVYGQGLNFLFSDPSKVTLYVHK